MLLITSLRGKESVNGKSCFHLRLPGTYWFNAGDMRSPAGTFLAGARQQSAAVTACPDVELEAGTRVKVMTPGCPFDGLFASVDDFAASGRVFTTVDVHGTPTQAAFLVDELSVV